MNNVRNKSEKEHQSQLFQQYNWFYKNYESAVQKAADEFFSEFFSVKLLSLSKNINILFQGDDYFVTKIRIDKQHDVFIRCSSEAIKLILDNVLGETKKFNLENITELEAKIISSFNDYVYSNTSKFLLSPSPAAHKRKNFDTIHLTFFIRENEADEGAKFIISLPEVLLAPESVQHENQQLDIMNFRGSKLEAKLKIGTTSFLLKEVKNIEKGDIVIFENSNINSMKLVYKGYKKSFRLNPNLGLVTHMNTDNGGNNMEEKSLSQDLWDNIQVEMGAEFEKVKITLGELKDIEEGLVVDLGSVYNSKVSLTIENKTIAKGELVIINDRYGVRVEEVLTTSHAADDAEDTAILNEEDAQLEETAQHHADPEENQSDTEFDYSDFELEDEDI